MKQRPAGRPSSMSLTSYSCSTPETLAAKEPYCPSALCSFFDSVFFAIRQYSGMRRYREQNQVFSLVIM